MAANNYYGIPVHGQAGSYTTAAYPGAPTAVGYTAVGQATAAHAATSYAQRVQPAAGAAQAAAAAYSAYPQAAPTYAAAAAPATPIVAATANTAYSYPAQYAAATAAAAQQLSTAAAQQQAAAAAGVPSAAYYPQQSIASVTYSTINNAYQTQPTYSHATHAQLAAVAARPAMAARSAVSSYLPSYSSAYTYAGQTAATTSYSYQPAQLQAASVTAAKPNIYIQPQQAATINLTPVGPAKVGTWRAVKPVGMAQNAIAGARAFKGPRIPPKPQSLHYCEVCKISCAGPQTYKEHLDGQKHKKKEASMKTGTAGPTTRGGNALRCELCDVTCTGSDAYAAHIRGAKHQKVVKLHTKLGKPIPCVDPVLVTKGSTGTTNSTPAGAQNITNLAKPGGTNSYGSRQPAVPKITFVGSDKIKTEPQANAGAKNHHHTGAGGGRSYTNEQEVTIPRLPEEKDVQPVGHDYIEEIKSDDGKVISFSCKLCECRFNDPNAKEMHMKGRRHRLQYKKKVNPDLVVDIKPSLRQRKLQEERAKRSMAREEFWKRREDEFRMMEDEERMYWSKRRRFEEEMDDINSYQRMSWAPQGRFGPNFGNPHFMMRRPDTLDDRHCMAKHETIYPGEKELEAIQKLVGHAETALKKVSDQLANQDSVDKKPVLKKEGEVKKEDEGKTRVLVGVMRVGLLAKQLLLKGDTEVDLVVLCGEKPTKGLLDRISNNLGVQLGQVAPTDKYEVRRVFEEACILVSTIETDQSKESLSVRITLTSPLMRESVEEAAAAAKINPPDILDHDRCLEALAELRHVKWFHSRALSRHSCTVVIRILRDLCLRNPTWSPLTCWSIELLAEKVLNSAGCPLSPGDALRRVFEALAGGILLPDSPGFLDPCEKEPMDSASNLTNQEREDITSSAQHAMRMIAFRQINKVLGIDALPAPKQWRVARKRRRDDADGAEGEEAEEKKDKKEA